MEELMMSLEDYDRLLNLVIQRRTIRQFKPDPLPEGSIEKIIEVARWAPSGFHTQPWEFVVVTKREVKEAIIEALDKYAPPIAKPESSGPSINISRSSFRDAPVFIIALTDWRAKDRIARPSERD